jgi:hypothetical protein
VLLQVEKVQYPKEFGNTVVPLVKHLKYNEKFAPAIMQVCDVPEGSAEHS